MSGSSRPAKSSWNGSSSTCSSRFCTRLRTQAPSAFGGPDAARAASVCGSARSWCTRSTRRCRRARPRRRTPPGAAPGSRWRTCSGGRRSRPRCRSAACERSRCAAQLRGSGRGSAPCASRSACKLHAGLDGRASRCVRHRSASALLVDRLGVAACAPRRGGTCSSIFCSMSAHSSARQPVRTKGLASVAQPVVGVARWWARGSPRLA